MSLKNIVTKDAEYCNVSGAKKFYKVIKNNKVAEVGEINLAEILLTACINSKTHCVSIENIDTKRIMQMLHLLYQTLIEEVKLVNQIWSNLDDKSKRINERICESMNENMNMCNLNQELEEEIELMSKWY